MSFIFMYCTRIRTGPFKNKRFSTWLKLGDHKKIYSLFRYTIFLSFKDWMTSRIRVVVLFIVYVNNIKCVAYMARHVTRILNNNMYIKRYLSSSNIGTCCYVYI